MGTKKDFTQIAFAVVQQATGGAPKPKRTAKQASGRAGGLKGGRTRMGVLSAEQRAELAKKAAAVRWGKAAPAKSTGAAVKRRLAK
jgi:hypothetical protein